MVQWIGFPSLTIARQFSTRDSVPDHAREGRGKMGPEGRGRGGAPGALPVGKNSNLAYRLKGSANCL